MIILRRHAPPGLPARRPSPPWPRLARGLRRRQATTAELQAAGARRRPPASDDEPRRGAAPSPAQGRAPAPTARAREAQAQADASGWSRTRPTAAVAHQLRRRSRSPSTPSARPRPSASFVSLARKGFYDGLDLPPDRPGLRDPGRRPAGDGTGGPGYSVRRAAAGGPRSYTQGRRRDGQDRDRATRAPRAASSSSSRPTTPAPADYALLGRRTRWSEG